jgi:acyl dehydratase
VGGVDVDRARVAGYRRLCGFPASDLLPPTYPQVVAFPLVLELLADPAFPFPALGTLHIGNRIVVRAPIPEGAPLELEVSAAEPLQHPRGRQVTVVVDVRTGGAAVWKAEMDLLHREADPRHDADSAPPPRELDVPDEPPNGPQVWRLPSDLGRRYAAVSGDRNPIHLAALTARPFGFRRHIAHGMWTHARALAEIANRLPDEYWVDVAFRRPVSLPGTVRFGARSVGAGVDFGLAAMTGETHLLGRVHPAERVRPAAAARSR